MALVQGSDTEVTMSDDEGVSQLKPFPLLPLEIIGMIALYLAQHDSQSAITAAFIHPTINISCLKLWTQDLAVLKIPSQKGYKTVLSRCKRAIDSIELDALRISGLNSNNEVVYQAYLMEKSNKICTELQLESGYFIDYNMRINDVQSLAILRGGMISYNRRRGHLFSLKELVILNAYSYTLSRGLSHCYNLSTIYFFSDEDVKDHKAFKKVVADPSVEYPTWLMQALCVLRKRIKRLYFVKMQTSNISVPWLKKVEEKEKTGQKYSKDQAWKVTSRHYVFHCNKSMNIFHRFDVARDKIKELEDGEE